MTKYTPGPWHVDCGFRLADDSYTWDVFAYDTDGERWMIAEGLTEANARLIAAAPDLLAALKRCINFLDPVNFAPEIKVAEAAVAKAEGQS